MMVCVLASQAVLYKTLPGFLCWQAVNGQTLSGKKIMSGSSEYGVIPKGT